MSSNPAVITPNVLVKIRNINIALKEAFRVLKPGGRFLCLEFSKVENQLLNQFYKIYSKSIPKIGKIVVGKSEPYKYLINSIEKFHSQKELLNLLKTRTELVKQVIQLKKFKKQIVDKKRIGKVLLNIKKNSIKKNIDPKVTNKIWKSMIAGYIEFEKRNFKKK